MLLTTTPSIEGMKVVKYCGIVSGETIFATNVIRDFMAGIRDFFGGRSKSYEEVLIKAKNAALQEMTDEAIRMGANAVIGIDLDYETVGDMMMVSCSGTAVILSETV